MSFIVLGPQGRSRTYLDWFYRPAHLPLCHLRIFAKQKSRSVHIAQERLKNRGTILLRLLLTEKTLLTEPNQL